MRWSMMAKLWMEPGNHCRYAGIDANITEAIKEKGIEVEKSEIRMPEGPIRLAGEYDIDLHLHAQVNATIKLTVIGEED